MINLIPPHAKRQVRFEYYARVVVVYSWLLVTAMMIVGTLFLSALFFINVQTAEVSEAYSEASDQKALVEEALNEVSYHNQLVDEIETYIVTEPLLPVVYEVQSLAGQLVTLNKIMVHRTNNQVIDSVEITGVASSRTSLISFRDSLEAVEQFGEVELPFANLARENDIPFSLSIPFTTSS